MFNSNTASIPSINSKKKTNMQIIRMFFLQNYAINNVAGTRREREGERDIENKINSRMHGLTGTYHYFS